MIMSIIQVLMVFVLFFPIKYLCWKITEVWGLPQWLEYEPWVCKKCLSFWSLLACFVAVGLLFHFWITMAVGLILTVLDTIAVMVDQKRKTIKIDYDENKEEINIINYDNNK